MIVLLGWAYGGLARKVVAVTRVIWTVNVVESNMRVDLENSIVVVDVEVGTADAPVPNVIVGIYIDCNSRDHKCGF